MKKILILAVFIALTVPAFAQTKTTNIVTTTVTNVLTLPVQQLPTGLTDLPGTLQSYFVDNDPNWNGWASNKFTVWQAAAFSSVNGVAGASSVGNGLGLEVPFHKWHLHLDSVTDFEQLFGDVHAQSFGVGYDYTRNQIHLSAGLDAQYTFAGHTLRAMPYIELIKQPTTLYGVAPFLRYAYPVNKSPGAGKFYVGLAISL